MQIIATHLVYWSIHGCAQQMNNSINNTAPENTHPCMRTCTERAPLCGVLVAFAHSRFSDAHIEHIQRTKRITVHLI